MIKKIFVPKNTFLISLLTLGLMIFPRLIYATDTLPFNIGEEAVTQELPNATAETIDPTKYRQSFASLLGDLLSIILPVSALLLLFYLIWGAVEWILSEGDKGKLEKARQKMTNAVIGIVLVSATVSIFMLIQQILNVCILDFWGNNCNLPSLVSGEI